MDLAIKFYQVFQISALFLQKNNVGVLTTPTFIIEPKIKRDIGIIIRSLCERKGVELLEAEACWDHIHILVSVPPKMSISSFMGYLKGKSTLMIFEKYANLKYKYGNRVFWCRGYYVSTVGKNKKVIEEYIRNQLKEDMETDQITIKEYVDPFKG